ncbi:hypothetical protein SAMN04515663_10894 [Alcanivorax sp. DSM 26293]|nr:hypothetical protein SAMN04515663_10894 [Alcanivorax sp. DSM 26293]
MLILLMCRQRIADLEVQARQSQSSLSQNMK